jgi:alanyl-tRNA synthetase
VSGYWPGTVLSLFSDETSERRYWRIDGFAQVPCGDTPIKNTQEIGITHLKRGNPVKSQERIEIFVEKKPQISGG